MPAARVEAGKEPVRKALQWCWAASTGSQSGGKHALLGDGLTNDD